MVLLKNPKEEEKNLKKKRVEAQTKKKAKAVNFGVIYGMGDFSLARNVGLTREEARQFISQYFETYPGVAAWLEQVKEQTRRDGFVTTLMNRRRYIADINSERAGIRAAAERVAINTPVQGSAADIIKVAMVNIHRELKQRRMKSKLLLQVHDELVLEVPEAEIDWVTAEVPRLMAGVAALQVPLVAEVGVGPNWEQAH